jgi:hypothetical protein
MEFPIWTDFHSKNLTYPQVQNLWGYEVHRVKGKTMRILIMTAITAVALPFMAFGQTTEEPQQTQGQTKDTQTTAPAKAKKMRPAQESNQEQTKPQAKPETGTDVRGQTSVKGRAHEINRAEPGTRSSTSQTNVNTNQTTTVNKEEFRTRHSEVFSLGRHPKEFFVQRYGASHFRLIGNSYFVFVDGCWVAVDVDGFTYTQRVICAGDPDFVEVVE